MLRITILLLLVTAVLFSYEDSDFDGVSDLKDRCPNTPITDIIDRYGCSIVKIMNDDPIGSRYDVIIGSIYDSADYGTAQDFTTVSHTFQADFFMKNWSFQFYTSYYFLDSDGSKSDGMNDTMLALYYGFKPFEEENLFLRAGFGAVLPTQDNNYNRMDYVGSLNANYIVQSYSFFGGYKYTFIGDENSDIFEFQNTESLNFGLGYYLKANIYTSLSYLNADSIIETMQKIQNISFYLFYGINTNWFVTALYSKGLSDSASDLTSNLRIGYYF